MDEKQPRKLDVLLNLEYSDMTNEEIEMVVEFKAEVKARDADFEKRQAEQQEEMKAITEIHKDAARQCKNVVSDLVKQATDRLNNDKKTE